MAFPQCGVKDLVDLFLGDAPAFEPSAEGPVKVVRTLAFDDWEVSPIVPMLVHPMSGFALESVLVDDDPEVLRIWAPVLWFVKSRRVASPLMTVRQIESTVKAMNNRPVVMVSTQ